MAPLLPAVSGHCPSAAFRRGHAVCSTRRQALTRTTTRQATGASSTFCSHLEVGEAPASSHTMQGPDASPYNLPPGADEHQPSSSASTSYSNNILSFGPSGQRTGSSGGARPFSTMRPLTGKAARPPQDGDVQRRITLDIKCTTTWQQAGRLFERCSDNFNYINITALLCHLAKLPAPPQPPQLKPLRYVDLGQSERVDGSAPAAPGRMWAPHATTSSWATQATSWAPQGHVSSAAAEEWDSYQSLLEELQVFAETMLHKMGPRELANTTHSFATMHAASRRYLQLVMAHAGRKLDGFKPQEIANLIWALAKAGHPTPYEWMDACISGPLTQFTSTFRNQELVNVIWAMAKLGHRPDPKWLAGAVDVLLSRPDTLCCQDVANLMFSLAKLRHRLRGSELQLLLTAAQRGGSRMSVHELSQILWAVGEMRPSSAQPLLPFLDFAASYLESAAQHTAATAPNYLASSLASLARLRYCPAPRACAALLAALQPQLQQCGAVDLGDLLWAVGTMQRLGAANAGSMDCDVSSSSSRSIAGAMNPSPAWLAAAESACSAVLPSCGPRALCRQGWAFAVLAHTPRSTWVEGYKEQLSLCVQACNDAELSIMLWSLAKLGVRDTSPTASWTAECVLELVEKVERKQQREQQRVLKDERTGTEAGEQIEGAGAGGSEGGEGPAPAGVELDEAKKKLRGRSRKVERRRGLVSVSYFQLHWRQQKRLQRLARAGRAKFRARQARKLQEQTQLQLLQQQQQREAAAALSWASVRCHLGPGPLLRLRHLALVAWALPRLLPLPAARRAFVAERHNLLRRMEAACVQPLRVCSSCWGARSSQAAAAAGSDLQSPGVLVLLASGFAALRHQPSSTWVRAHRLACLALKHRFSKREVKVLRAACHALQDSTGSSSLQPRAAPEAVAAPANDAERVSRS